jgi:hypothetical protein
MSDETITKLREKAGELYRMMRDDDDLIRLNASRSPIWAHFARRRIQLAKEIDAMLSALKLEEVKGA